MPTARNYRYIGHEKGTAVLILLLSEKFRNAATSTRPRGFRIFPISRRFRFYTALGVSITNGIHHDILLRRYRASYIRGPAA